jgi:hypothetical protein
MKVRPKTRDPNKGKDSVTHVEAHESTSEPCSASRAGAPNYVYAERASDGE